MKRLTRLLLVGFLLSQMCASVVIAQPTKRILAADLNERTWQVENIVDLGGGELATNRFSYVELSDGLYFRNDQGQLEETDIAIQVTPSGGSARKGAIKAAFRGNLKNQDGFVLDLPGNKKMAGAPVFLALTDSRTGQSVMISQLQDCSGELVGVNQVLFSNAFAEGVRASVLYTYGRNRFSQDILLHEAPDIAAYGFDETALLQVWTEITQSPNPSLKGTKRIIGNTEVSDTEVDFGSHRLGNGVAFMTESFTPDKFSGVSVAKEWIEIDGRTFLVESLPYAAIASELSELPLGVASKNKPKQSRQELIAALNPIPKNVASLPLKNGNRLALAQKSFLIDFEVVNAGALTSKRFKGNVMYHVTGEAQITNVVFEAGTLIKFAKPVSGSSPSIKIYGTVECLATPYRPIVFTAEDDHTVGQAITANTLSGFYATGALALFGSSPRTLSNLKISHANVGIYSEGANSVFENVQMVNNNTSIRVPSGQQSFRNFLINQTTRVFDGSSSPTYHAEHFTVNVTTTLGSPSSTLNLTNSLLVAVGSTNTSSINFSHVQAASSGSGIFQTVGAGNHYLLAESPYLNQGRSDTLTVAQLKDRTTQPPIILTNIITSDLTLQPIVPRDTGNPDLGYSYPVVDYAVNATIVTNCTLILTNGVSIANFGSSGLRLRDNARLVTRGLPDRPVEIARYFCVQEQSFAWGSPNYSDQLTLVTHTVNAASVIVDCDFTFFDSVAENGRHLYNFDDWKVVSMTFKNSAFGSGELELNTQNGGTQPTILFQNTLLESSFFNMESGGTLDVYNCMFKDGTLAFNAFGGNTWNFKDNVMEGMTFQGTGSPGNRTHNAFVGITNPFTPGTGELSPSSIAWQVALPRRYYQPSSSPLFNAGSRTGSQAGLHWFATKLDQVNEAASQVDIGLHYPSYLGDPLLDTDQDGVANIFEDTNGNGVFNNGETNFDDPFSTLIRVWITRPTQGQRIP